jgi:hypothetical protein
MEYFLKQQVFPEVLMGSAATVYQLLGSPKVYLFSDTFTLEQIQSYLVLEYPESGRYLLDYLELRPREQFLLDSLNINPNSLVILTYPDNLVGDRKDKFVLNYAVLVHDLCCQGVTVRVS